MKIILAVASAFASMSVATAVYADQDHRRCGNVPVTQWMSETDLRARISPLGLEVGDIDIDDGCYEVEARNKDGRKIEIGFHPQTGEQVWIDGDD